MVFLEEFFKKVDFEINQPITKKHAKLPSRQRVNHDYIIPQVQIGNHFQRSCQRTILNIFLAVSFNMCFGCSKEPSHRDGSFEYQQHMFWLRNEKIHF